VSMSSRSEWDQMTFPHLWTRILHLEHALQNAKPWSFWVLFRDRREKLPFWTFLLVLPVLIRYFVANVFRFATIILLLTFLQVILGVVQVIAGFKD
jgi:magnesium-transporting ATPase (P-type)